MSESAPRNDLDPSGFFVLRTPLLPFEELESWSADLQAPAVDDDERLGEALAEDRRRLRERLLELLERPVVREALFVASPSLLSGLAAWRADPDSKKGRRAEEALVRYLFRMTTRATPFGLFSGCSIGETGADSRLRLQRRRAYRRHTRLDMGYLAALAEALEKESALRRRLRYRPNSSLYRAAGRLRYAESKLAGQQRSYHLVAVETAPYLERVLRRAGRGATPRELAQDLVRSGIEDVSVEEALEFIGELIDSELLVTSLSPNVTGSEPIHDLIEQIGERQAPVTTLLEEVRDSLARLDGEGPGARTESYRTVARRLEELPAEVELPRLFQVDLFKPVDVATLGPRVFDEVRRGVDLLHRLAGPAEDGALSRFCQDFTARYEESQPVPLVEVLDEELGIGFDAAPGADASPLLDGLALPPRHGEVSVRWGSRARLLLAKLQEATAAGAREIRLQVADLESFPHRGLPPLPDAFQVTVTLAAASEEAMNDGDFQLYLRGAGGPSGARLLGRFCHPEDRLRSRVEGHLRQEEALQPDAVFAEIAHLPEGRVGNVLCRPVLRDYEIPFLGRSGADPSRQIPITDLDVSVSGQTIELRSRRLGRRVIPRLTNAHNFSARSLGIYRFLCSLQHQGVRPGLGWAWGALDGLAFLPRVTFGRVLLSRATWRVEPREVEDLARAAGAERFKAVQLWRGHLTA